MYKTDDINAADKSVCDAFDDAEKRHPDWSGLSFSDMTLILAEECGEAIQVVNDMLEYENDPQMQADLILHYVVEVAQVGAVARRILTEIHRRDRG